MEPQCIADVEGPWIDPQFDSGLIERCRRYWTTPISEVPDIALITYLHERSAPLLVISEARERISVGQPDGTELWDGHLAESLENAANA